tara:strand:+ start:171 stop:626 length:456 start_codon:yes stop_codon:yes gene_type:complete
LGHWEGDLIIGLGHKSAIGTLVERTSTLTYIVKLKDRKSRTVITGFTKEFNRLNSNLTKTLTYDNGLEMARHKQLTEATVVKVYFAHPYSSWERGTNENTNGLIRRYFPKKTDFNTVNEQQLKQFQNMLNNRPGKVLIYKTPMEVFNQNST